MNDYKKLVDDTLFFIAQKGWTINESSFYDSLAMFLSENLEMAYVLIDRISDKEGNVETITFVDSGVVKTNISYPLLNTPCENVVGKSLCVYTSNVQMLFPEDDMLAQMKAESYIGIPLWDSKGQAIGLIALLDTKPITNASEIETILQIVAVRVAHEIERNNFEQALIAKNKALERQNKELEQFTYIASHDLQEPLRTLTSINQLFQDEYKGRLDERGNTYLKFINESANRMQKLVKGLLDYSKIGKLGDLIEIDCNEVLREVLLDISLSIKENNAKIIIEDLPIVKGYRTELRQLFQNLIVNAMKFIDKDTAPEIDISAKELDQEWLFSIKDNGIGIDQKDKEKIFVIFKRLHNRNNYEGTGIGLSNCKKIAELHGGNIWVNSKLFEGSTFYFTITKTKNL
ncbi:ATP-binding protein [Roseivirga sp.]|uniref:GAF domain-containing sensor histidine kinase n=1 Tax=Roseivirga sp. TaxID=1964215 RepID=UPI002B27652C|nr:ATP-binding protein [Roseivirga sp.]